MPTITLSYLKQIQRSVSFQKQLSLTPNIFEIFDIENNFVFVRYNDLSFLFEFCDKLSERGWNEGNDYWITDQVTKYRLNLLNGNLMVEYNGFHDLYFYQNPMPAKTEKIILYFRDLLVSSVIPPENYGNFLTSDNHYFYDSAGQPLEVIEE